MRRIGRIAALALGLGVLSVAAQDESTPTLHVYTNLVQIPTLVVDTGMTPVTGIAANRFFVSLDGGPKFRVTHVRPEGDDPISLAIVLDVSQPFPSLMTWMDDAVAGMVPLSLHAKDRVSVYSMDCGLGRSANNLPADPQMLKQAVRLALEAWRKSGRDRWRSSCKGPVNLWDSLTVVTRALSERPGRRVMLVVTDGVDRGSKTKWNELRMYAQEKGVAIFGMVQTADTDAGRGGSRNHEDLFDSVCNLSGGVVMTGTEKKMPEALAEFATLVRTRYIVEFPHPVDTKGGYHDMNITIDQGDAYVLPSGIGIPVDDPAILQDPTTVPMDPADVPQVGKRRVVAPN